MNNSKRALAAKQAFSRKDAKATSPTHEDFDHDQHKQGIGEYIGSMVYGALDGTVTTFAVVAGAAGAGLGPGIVLVLGFANLLADGLSMAAGTYLSMKSQQSFYNAQRKREEWEVDNYPQAEREEIRQIYRKKGFEGSGLEKLVELLTSKKTVWVDTMMSEEVGIIPEQKNPLKAAGLTYLAFAIAGLIPLLIFVISIFYPIPKSILFPMAFALTFVTIFAVGSLRSLVIAKNWFTAGLEMLLIGGLTAIVAYVIGAVLGGFVL